MLKELDTRDSEFVSVSLLWDSMTNLTYVEISSHSDDSVSTFAVPAETALDAFRHPYAYLPRDCNATRGSAVTS